jgi:hypothetical protein
MRVRLIHGLTLATAIALIVPSLAAQGTAQAQGDSVAIKGGGISVKGWTGKVDASRENGTLTITDGKFAAEGSGFRITTGPSATYWNPANKATGDYTVSATFNEPKYMNLNDHPHPYGIAFGGNDLDTENMSIGYCSVYGNGTYIMRGFGPAAFAVGGRTPTANAAIAKAAAKNDPVTQMIAVSVKGGNVECSVNGTVVGTFPKTDLVGPGKLKSTDGVYGLRFGHNTEVIVTGFSKK